MRIIKRIYQKPLIQVVKLKIQGSLMDPTHIVETSLTPDDGQQWAKPKDFDDDDFNFEKGGVGDWENKEFTDPPSWE